VILFGTDPLADLSALDAGLANRSAVLEESEERRIVDRILAAYDKAHTDQKGVLPAYQLGGEWDYVIGAQRQEYLTALVQSDVGEISRLLRNFFRNSGASGLVPLDAYSAIGRTRTRRKRSFVRLLLQDYQAWRDLTANTDPEELRIPTIGNPWGYFINKRLVIPGICRNHYFAHQASALLSDVPGAPTVAEIGGGYGGFACFLLSTPGRYVYVNFDLPEILLIEQYYLMAAFPEKKFLLYGEEEPELGRALESYDVILMPNFELPKLPDDSVDLFINTGSLSEMDYATVEEYVAQIARTCRLYFFHENSDRAVRKAGGHFEVPSSCFPIPETTFRRIYKAKAPWAGYGDRLWEHLYVKRH
jgi:putative sugar O-methyltransferase